MTNSFVAVFADHRGNGAPIPATFRRMGIESFTDNRAKLNGDVQTTVRMPGRPGQELRTSESNERIRQVIQGFVTSTDHKPVEEHRFENGRLIGRTIYPSIASNDSCVDCHNTRLGNEIYQIGDVMGAFVVESDLTVKSWRNAYYSVGAFTIAFMAFGALAQRERGRMNQVVDGLKARVKLERKKAEAEAHANFLTSHDALTGVPNRERFTSRLKDELEQLTVEGISVGLLDLDEFKTVNDTMGHGAGDALLAEVASRLSSVMQKGGGFVARLGGDEFALLFKADDFGQSPKAVGQSILDALGPAFSHEEYVMQPKGSLGIATIGSHEALSSTEALQFADAALYAAKREGKNQFKLFDEAIRSSLLRRTEIATQFPQAILRDEIRPALQPKVCLKTGQFMGFEALGRWRLGSEDISPIEFIPIVEKIGLIRELDLAVLAASSKFVAQQEAETGLTIPLSANISALNFRSSGLAEAIQDILWETRLSPERLTLEVTESTAVENWGAVQDVLEVLRPLGVKASLDDFGTGYSSLSYLRRFKFEEIKIDRDFIVDITDDKETRFLFESIVDMAAGLGSTIVVEGIETPAQARIVSARGAHIGQGFLFSKPLEIEQARKYLRDHGGHEIKNVG